MKPRRLQLAREEVNNEEGDMEMDCSVAYQHTDSYRNHDRSDELHGIKSRKMGLPKFGGLILRYDI